MTKKKEVEKKRKKETGKRKYLRYYPVS